VLSAGARVEKAEGEYRAALAIRKQLVKEFPKVPGYRNDLGASHSNLAGLLRNTDRLQEAEAEYGVTLHLQKQLVKEFPNVPVYRQELAAAHHNLGALLQATRRPREAETEFRAALAIRKRLVKDSPKEPAHRRLLAATHTGLGIVFATTRRPREAKIEFRAALDLGEQLAAGFPTVPEYRRELAGSHNNLGRLLAATDRPKEAETEFRAALDLGKQLAADFAAVPDYQNALAGTMVDLAEVLYRARKDFQAARQLLEEALPHHRAALEANPQHPEYRQFYCKNRLLLTLTLLALGDHRAASATAEQRAEAAVDPVHDTFDAVRNLVGRGGSILSCTELAEKDDNLDEAQRQKLVQQYGDRAMKLLRQAVQNGFKDVQLLKGAPAPFRSRADFQELVAELEKTLRPD
jgi:tetratricopeptide (TPR) repeat protein